ncbi:hypothetical protein GDO81_008936 [Engystomops pustulosus]|uniref:Uncharacterized protein n=1 Tax=Engystomops pustulosus TaxID=76066 RepID=A0AAV7BN91_ENGPU|nr:hypothetical protein GDO81_008936 [Engystomops pustulosus]KAG8573914.1 hypothetical protein GDO81_008936 [Engystomops pustulosus]KAG8573915.1 hypothetical protein GDO81_008936 [Engystomops pustulosus]KAG8573916.1 hypothetical protein GDO81_008936 [Engystomops pustulosus]KAG8573917.1 hypothetical protein GDO81_008936 [Engystomops pustulosus]
MTSNHKSIPIQTQPQNHSNAYPDVQMPTTGRLPCELDCLNKVDEIIFKDKVFQTRNGKSLFSVHREAECYGSKLDLYLQDGFKKNVVCLHLNTDHSDDPHLQIFALPMQPVGSVTIDSISGNLSICIQMAEDTPTFIACLPMFLQTQKSTSIEIFCIGGSQQVAKIMCEKDSSSSQVVFQFFTDIESGAKTVILGAFLYLNFHLNEIRKMEDSPSNFQDLWIINCVSWDKIPDSHSGEDGTEKGCCRRCLGDCSSCFCGFWGCLLSCAECCLPLPST